MKKLIAPTLIVAILAGCAAPGGPQQTQRSGVSNSAVGGVTGALLGGLLGAQAGKGNGKAAMAALGAVAGGMVGASIGQTMDEVEARRTAEQIQTYYPRDAFGARIETYPAQAQNPQTGQVQQINAVKTMNFDVARYAVIANPGGGLSHSAVSTLQKLNGYTTNGAATLTVLVPPQDLHLIPAIRGQAPGAQVYQSPDLQSNKWVFTVVPRA